MTGEPGAVLPLLPVLRTRQSAFSYTCNGCNRCCYGKRIQLNPYELTRLARNRGVGTAELIRRYTRDGTALRTRSDGACVFLGDRGCTVHPDRPLACRLYPLGRVGAPDGTETFVELEAHPESAGCYEGEGTVASYLEEQEVAPYLRAANRYRELLSRIVAALQARSERSQEEGSEASRNHEQGDDPARFELEVRPSGGEPSSADEPTEANGLPDARDLLDVDGVVAAHCRRVGRQLPRTVDEAIELHLEAIEAALADL